MSEYNHEAMMAFGKELTKLLNKHSIDAYCETSDFILSAYIVEQLVTFGDTVKWIARQKDARVTMELEQE